MTRVLLFIAYLTTAVALSAQHGGFREPGSLCELQSGNRCLSFDYWPVISAEEQSFDSAIVTIQELRHRVPSKAQKEMEKAEHARTGGRWDEAIAHYSRAIEIDQEFVAARVNLAVVYMKSADTAHAVAQLEAAIRIDPGNPVAIDDLTVTYIASRKFEAAERAARLAANIDRTGRLPEVLLGIALVKQHKLTGEALKCLKRAHEEFPLAHLFSAEILMSQGNREGAIGEIRTYLSVGTPRARQFAADWLDLIEHDGLGKAIAAFR